MAWASKTYTNKRITFLRNLQSSHSPMNLHLGLIGLTYNTPNTFVVSHNNTLFLCKIINTQIPSLLQLPSVLTASGTQTYFWLDTHQTPLAIAFPILFTHTTNCFVRVATIINYGLEKCMQNHLFNVASVELASLSSLLQDFQLSSDHDVCFLQGGQAFSARLAYGLIMREGDIDTHDRAI